MNVIIKFTALVIALPILLSWNQLTDNWIIKKQKAYSIKYTEQDRTNIKEYNRLIKNGMKKVTSFFGSMYKNKFQVFVHPNRYSLDSAWQKEWNMPGFKSECWMVASGIATKLDIISPVVWNKEACEHVYKEKEKTQQLITHELVHVYHGQLNSSPDFSNTEGIDWFVEGLATYASGQLDSLRIKEIKEAIADNNIPSGLDGFWKGKLKYALSGSVVLFIDKKYGRAKLSQLLPFNNKSDMLSALGLSESELLSQWGEYMQKL